MLCESIGRFLLKRRNSQPCMERRVIVLIRTVDVHIARLRKKKLGDFGNHY